MSQGWSDPKSEGSEYKKILFSGVNTKAVLVIYASLRIGLTADHNNGNTPSNEHGSDSPNTIPKQFGCGENPVEHRENCHLGQRTCNSILNFQDEDTL